MKCCGMLFKPQFAKPAVPRAYHHTHWSIARNRISVLYYCYHKVHQILRKEIVGSIKSWIKANLAAHLLFYTMLSVGLLAPALIPT